MSLLEDVFLEDEAGEAQELERIIEGDEFDERARSATPNSDENSAKEDEAEEEKRRVDPSQAKTKRVIKNPRFILNPARLTGPRGIQVLPEHFKDFTFKGKGHEKEDLDLVLKKLEHWAYRLYPKFEFADCLRKIETLGKKRPVMVHLHKIRTDQFMTEETVHQKDSSDEDNPPASAEVDEFDVLLQQQIDLARTTKGMETPVAEKLIMPKATPSPFINDEQRERMLKNRRLAEERRLARLQKASLETHTSNSNDNINNDGGNNNTSHTNDNNTNSMNDNENSRNSDSFINKDVIDSSDEETDYNIAGQSITVDIHRNLGISQNNYASMNENDNINNKQNNSNESVKIDIHCNSVSVTSQINDENVNGNIKNKHKKSNVIDSSDDETDNNVVSKITRKNEEILYDNMINTENNDADMIDHEGHNNYSVVLQKNVANLSDNIINTGNNDREMNIESELYKNETYINKIDTVIPQEDINTETSKLTEHSGKDNDIINSLTKETNQASGNDNLQENDIPEDIMDVDLNNDF